MTIAPAANLIEQIYATPEHPYSTLPETQEDLKWADLVNLDLSKFDTPGGKQALAKQLRHAAQSVGFFYVTNAGFTQEEVDEQFAIGRDVFDLPYEAKEPFAADHANGGYNGYTGPDLPHFSKKDSFGFQKQSNIEVFNLPRFVTRFNEWHAAHQPKPIADKWSTVVDFGKRVHSQVIEKLLVILALVLELEDEQYFVDRHRYQDEGEDHLRYMKYKSRGKESENTDLYTGGHTDLGTLTLLFRQPVAGLQVLGSDDVWRWVKPLPGSITVNFGDLSSLLTGGLLKSSIHRVSRPPADQVQYDRHGVLYFVRPSNNVLVETVQGSPVIAREGIYAREAEQEHKAPITVETWVRERQRHIFSSQQQARYKQLVTSDASEGAEKKELETDVAGIRVKYWN